MIFPTRVSAAGQCKQGVEAGHPWRAVEVSLRAAHSGACAGDKAAPAAEQLTGRRGGQKSVEKEVPSGGGELAGLHSTGR